MFMSKRTHPVMWIACTLSMLSPALQAASPFPALDRPALQARAPERQVMTAAAQAGDRLVAVGERGVVVLSDDGGRTWRQARRVPVSTTLTAVSFVHHMLGWAVGHGGVVLHTHDGGETWEKQADGMALANAASDAAAEAARRHPESQRAAQDLEAAKLLIKDGADKPLLDVQFTDALHGRIVGAYNLFFETNDGGKTWTSGANRLENPKSLHLYAIRSRGSRVYIVGEQGQLHRSVDGGHTFEALPTPYKGSLFSLDLADKGDVVIAGLRGNAFRSVDDGASWVKIDDAPPVSFISVSAFADGGVLLGNQAGQVFLDRPGFALTALSVPPLFPLAGMVLLKDESLLALGAGGVVRVPLELGKSKAPK